MKANILSFKTLNQMIHLGTNTSDSIMFFSDDRAAKNARKSKLVITLENTFYFSR